MLKDTAMLRSLHVNSKRQQKTASLSLIRFLLIMSSLEALAIKKWSLAKADKIGNIWV